MRGRQLAGFWDDVGNAIGNFGNSWQGGEDQAMYADPSSSLANPGYATAAGVSNFGDAVVSLAPDPRKIILTALGLGIILASIISD